MPSGGHNGSNSPLNLIYSSVSRAESPGEVNELTVLSQGFLEALGAGAWGELTAKGRLKEVSPDQWPQMCPVSSFEAVPTHGTLRKLCSQSKPQEDIQISLYRKKSALWKFCLIT